MKKILFILILITSVVYAQEFTVTPNGLRDNANLEQSYVVINTPGKTAEQNYNNTIKYINKTYKSPNFLCRNPRCRNRRNRLSCLPRV